MADEPEPEEEDEVEVVAADLPLHPARWQDVDPDWENIVRPDGVEPFIPRTDEEAAKYPPPPPVARGWRAYWEWFYRNGNWKKWIQINFERDERELKYKRPLFPTEADECPPPPPPCCAGYRLFWAWATTFAEEWFNECEYEAYGVYLAPPTKKPRGC